MIYGTFTNSLTDRELSEAHARYVKALESDLAAAHETLQAAQEQAYQCQQLLDDQYNAETLRADLAAARAERDTLWAYVSSGITITNHEEYCEACGHNDAPCAEKKRLEAENMRAFDAVMKIVAK